MTAVNAERRPLAGAANTADGYSTHSIVTPITDPDWQEPAYVIRVQVNDIGGTRVYLYRSLGAAERAVERATKRGRESKLTLCTLTPVGVS